MSCALANGQLSDFVVKTLGGCDFGSGQLVKELVVAELADYFSVPHPRHVFVQIDSELADLIAQTEPSKAELIKRSIGINFGSEMLSNLITWPVDRRPSPSQFSTACAVFAFDVMVQNPDRKYDRPNLGVVGDQIFVFDHELCFSSQYALTTNLEPWRVGGDPFWTTHVFYGSLHRQELEFGDFFARLKTLTVEFFDQIADELPQTWDISALEFIKQHMQIMSAHSDQFSNEIAKRLA